MGQWEVKSVIKSRFCTAGDHGLLVIIGVANQLPSAPYRFHSVVQGCPQEDAFSTTDCIKQVRRIGYSHAAVVSHTLKDQSSPPVCRALRQIHGIRQTTALPSL